MPTFAYEAMDSSGLEVKDTIEAPSEAEAQTMIREKGFYVTKIREKDRKKTDKKKAGTTKGAQKGKTFTIGGVNAKKLCTICTSTWSRPEKPAVLWKSFCSVWPNLKKRRSRSNEKSWEP